jgi:hypothetical protein
MAVMITKPNLRVLFHWNVEAVQIPLTIAVALRLSLGIMAFVAYILYPQSPLRTFPSPSRDTSDISVILDRTLTMWSNWDGHWYLQIAEQGYQADPASQAFFPLYPMLVRGFGILLFGNYQLAGILISTIMAIIAFIIFYELTKRDFDRQLAERTIFYFSIFPTIFYLFAVYTEATFIALILGSFFAARHLRKWWLAGLLGALAALTRNLGVVIVIPLLLEWILYRWDVTKETVGAQAKLLQIDVLRKLYDSTIFSLGLPVVTFFGWLAFSQFILGNALGSVTSHSNWGRSFMFPWSTLLKAVQPIFTPGANGFIAIKIDWYQGANLVDLSFFIMGFIVFLYGCWKSIRREFPLSYLIFFAFGLFVPLIDPVNFSPLLSFPRFLLPLFPLFILWAQACRRHNWLHFVTLYLWLPCLGILFILFANGYWVA